MAECDVLGVFVDAIDQSDLEREIMESVKQDRQDVFAYVNVHAVNIAHEDTRFRHIINDARRAYCDGEGVRLGARILGQMLPRRIVLTYWIWDLCALFERQGISIFLLGGRPGVVDRACRRLREKYPALQIVGSHHGFFAKTGLENEKVLTMIEEAAPDVLFVGFGMPLQEYWIEGNFRRLRAHAILPAGSMIDYVAGIKRATPPWMANHGMEWLYRLLTEPGRLWRRYLIGNPKYLAAVLLQRIRQRKDNG